MGSLSAKQQSCIVINVNSVNQETIENTEKNVLLNKDKQNHMIIWGGAITYIEYLIVKQQIEQKYSFMQDCIIQCQTSKVFRDKASQYCENNVIFLISGSFAIEVFEGMKNLEWINQQINDQAVHSQAIIIFTSNQTITLNNWTIQYLQQECSYMTSLVIDYTPLYDSIDNMIYNRIHKGIEQKKNLDFYFGSKTNEILTNFQNSNSLNLDDLKPSVIKLKDNLLQICKYIKQAQMKTSVVDFINKKQLQQFCDKIENCFKKSYKDPDNTQLKRHDIVENILNLYTEEGVVYKIINLLLNTMNPIIYQYMQSINKLFSQCLYEFQDDQQEAHIQVYRGGAIQKYIYENLYKQFILNTSKELTTFIIFPQFLSSTLNVQVATNQQEVRSQEVIKITQNRITQEDSQKKQISIENSSKENEFYLKSDKFQDHFKIIFNINGTIDLNNKNRPKYIQKVSTRKIEKEFLFQPFQQFQVLSMDGPGEVTKEMTLQFKI